MLEQLLTNLNSKQEPVRNAAMRDARALPPEEFLTLLEVGANRRHQRQRQVEKYINGYLICAALTFISFCMLISVFGMQRFILYGGLVFNLLRWPYEILSNRYGKEYQNADDCLRKLIMERAAREDNLRFIIPALIFQDTYDGKSGKDLFAALERMLLQLRPDQVKNWTKEQKATLLLPLIKPFRNVDLTISVLKALEQVGDEQALPVVQKLAERKTRTPDEHSVRLAARECLPYLTAHAGEARNEQTLLRPSSAVSSSSPGTLLRPAGTIPDSTPVEQLLRPGCSEE